MVRKKIPEDKKKFECPVEGCDCGEGGKRKMCANPSAVKNHVRFKHPEKFAALYPETKEGGDPEEGKSFRKGEGSGSGSGSGGEKEGGDWGGWVPF